MTSHNAPVHLVGVRVRLNNTDASTENKFLKISTATKRMRPGIALVEVETSDNIEAYPDRLVGIAVYDRHHKPGGTAELTMLVQGVAEVTCNRSVVLRLQRMGHCYILRKISGDDNNAIWRCYWNIAPRQNQAGGAPTAIGQLIAVGANVTPLGGIESSENHCVQTRTFDVTETDLPNYDSGMVVPGTKDDSQISGNNTRANATDPTNYTTALVPANLQTHRPGILLWPLTQKAVTSKKGSQYKKAAVLQHGVVTLYFNDENILEMKSDPCNKIVQFQSAGNNTNLYGQVLEVYQRSARIRLLLDVMSGVDRAFVY